MVVNCNRHLLPLTVEGWTGNPGVGKYTGKSASGADVTFCVGERVVGEEPETFAIHDVQGLGAYPDVTALFRPKHVTFQGTNAQMVFVAA